MKYNFLYICVVIALTCSISGCSKKHANDFPAKQPGTTQMLQTNYSESGEAISYVLNVYDDKANLIETTYYNLQKEVLYSTKMIYGENGCLKDIQDYNQEGELRTDIEYEFDESGHMLYQHFYTEDHEPNYSYCYVYDENGKMTLRNTVYPEGIISESSYYTAYEYNPDGTLNSANDYEGVGDTHLTTCVKYYYENGNVIKEVWYDCHEEPYTEKDRAEYTYDESNRMKSICWYRQDIRYQHGECTYID